MDDSDNMVLLNNSEEDEGIEDGQVRELISVLSLDPSMLEGLRAVGIESLDQLGFAEPGELSELGLTLGQRLKLRRWKAMQTSSEATSSGIRMERSTLPSKITGISP